MVSNKIGTLNEKPLHAALKRWYSRPGDRFEVSVDGFVVDIVRGDLLIEVQTQSFSAIKRKLCQLVPRHPVRLVYPIAREKWIVKLAADGLTHAGRRKSPKRNSMMELFVELVPFSPSDDGDFLRQVVDQRRIPACGGQERSNSRFDVGPPCVKTG